MTREDVVNGHGPAEAKGENGTTSFAIKAGLAQMLKGGVIMDVVNAEQVFNHVLVLAGHKQQTTVC